MQDYAQQTVDHYLNAAGIDKVKTATTPFVPDGAITEHDEGRTRTSSLLMYYEGIMVSTSWTTGFTTTYYILGD